MSYQVDASTAVGYGIVTALTIGIVGGAVDGIVIDVHKRNAEKEKKKKAEIERIMNTPLKKFSDSYIEQIASKYETGGENANTDAKQPEIAADTSVRNRQVYGKICTNGVGIIDADGHTSIGTETLDMGILSRFTTIMKANINALLGKTEDPATMVDQYLIDLNRSLAEVKSETAGAIAEEKRTASLAEKNAAESNRMESLAKKALQSGNDDDARVFLAKKQQIDATGKELKKAADVAHANAEKMRQTHDKLVSDIDRLKILRRRETIKAKSAEAMDEMNEQPVDAVEELECKYAEAASDSAVTDELSRLKSEMGL